MIVTPPAAYRDPCDPSSMSIVTATIPSLPLPPSLSNSLPSVQYPSQQQLSIQDGVSTKSTLHVSSQKIASLVISSAGSHSKVASSGSSKKTMASGGSIKPLSTQERMSLFLEHSAAVSNNRSTPKIVIRKDAKFKSACNKIRWLNKASEVAMVTTMTSPGERKADDNKEMTGENNSSQFYSFHEKVDPSLDEAVNPPIKLPSALLVSYNTKIVAGVNLVISKHH